MTELSLLVKATLVMAIGLTGARLARRSRASVRHLVLVATFGTLVALPVVALVMPSIVIGVPVGDVSGRATPGWVPGEAADGQKASGPVSSVARVMPAGDTASPAWPTTLRMVWAAGAAVILASLAAALWRLRRIRRAALPCLGLQGLARTTAADAGVTARVEVVTHERVAAPLTYGVRCSTIVMPPDIDQWKAEDVRRALIHELEHIRRGDWLIQLAVRIVCAVYWFHPLVWTAWRQLCLDAERACDDAVARSTEGTDYAEQLVLLARRLAHGPAPPTLSMSSRSDLSARVSALLDASQRRGPAGGLSLAATVGIAALVVLSLAPLRAVAAADDSEIGRPTIEDVDVDVDVVGANQRSRATSLDRALYRAAERGDVNRITQLIDAGANVNAKIDGDGSPLIGAARKGKLAAVRLLLDRGADPNLPVDGDGNPLIMAAREGHVDVVTLLLDRGAQIDLVVPSDENALIQASGEGHLPVVKLLVARGADVNARVWADSAFERPDGEWRTPMSMARKGRHTAVVEFLRSAGAQ